LGYVSDIKHLANSCCSARCCVAVVFAVCSRKSTKRNFFLDIKPSRNPRLRPGFWAGGGIHVPFQIPVLNNNMFNAYDLLYEPLTAREKSKTAPTTTKSYSMKWNTTLVSREHSQSSASEARQHRLYELARNALTETEAMTILGEMYGGCW